MATDIFISYSRKDSIFARKLVDALTAQGRNSWVDWEGIPYSADWWREICTGIDAADTFVFIISPNSLASMICNRELAYARSNYKRILPVMHQTIDEKQIAGEWFEQEWEANARENWAELKKQNWLFFRDSDDFDKAVASLLTTAEQDPDHIRHHTRLLVRAREWDTNGRKVAYALRGEDLREAEIWQAASTDKQPALNDLHIAYIYASQQVHKDEQNRNRALTQARFGIVLAIALLALLGFVFVNLRSSEQTSANATLASQATAVANQAQIAQNNLSTADARATEADTNLQQARSLAQAANAEQVYAEGDPFTGYALALAANSYANPPALAQQALINVAYPPGLRRRFNGHDPDVFVLSVSFSPDGNRIVSSGSYGELILWMLVVQKKSTVFTGVVWRC